MLTPSLALVQRDLANVALREGDATRAWAIVRSHANLFPESGEGLLLEAQVAFKLEEFAYLQGLLRQLETLALGTPWQCEHDLLRAQVAAFTQDDATARTYAVSVLAQTTSPHVAASAHLVLGEVCLRAGNITGAAAAFAAAEAYEPTSQSALGLCEVALSSRTSESAALAQAQVAIERDTHNPHAYVALSRSAASVATRYAKECKELAVTACTLLSEDHVPNADYALGLLQLQNANPTRALVHLDEAVLSPMRLYALRARANARMQLGLFLSAASDLELYLSTVSDRVASSQLALCYQLGGQASTALDVLTRRTQ